MPMITERRQSGWLPFAFALTLSSCSSLQSSEPKASEPGVAPPSSATAALEPRPWAPLTPAHAPGRWRLATPEQLEGSLLWASQILIAHRDVTPRVGCFELPDWTPRSHNPERSRQAAFDLAESIAQKARAAPEQFAELARQHSDDVMSRGSGGALGGRPAIGLTDWPEILDAFEALAPGEVSRVVETEFGFHVLRREAPPEERRVSGARIIIGYDEAPWLHRFLARRTIPARSRAAALELAESVYQSLVRHPEEFPRFVEQYSDHRDAIRGGDFGEWSTREATPFFQERVVLEQLAPGQVSPPFDSPFGVQIIMRTPERPRPTYSMVALALDFDPTLPPERAGSLAARRSELAATASALRRNPDEFEARRARECCAAVETWVQGRGDPAIEAALERLAPTEIGVDPVVIEGSRVALLRRLDARRLSRPDVSFDLPRPAAPDREWLVGTYGDSQVLRAVAERAGRELPLDPTTAAALAGLALESGQIDRAESAEARLGVFHGHEQRVLALLGAERFELYHQIFDRYLEERLLRARPLGLFRDAATGLPYLGWPLL